MTNTHSASNGVGIYIFILGVNAVITGFLVYVLFYYAIMRPLPDYVAVPDNYSYNQNVKDGNYFTNNAIDYPPFAMVTLDQPMKSVNQIADLAAMTAVTSLTFDFFNYYKQLDNIRYRFTAKGWTAFSSSLVQSGLLDAILKKKLSTSAVVVGAPVLLQRGMLEGSYAWKYQMVVLVTYESLSDKVTKSQVVTIVFKRVPLIGRDAEVGVAVDSFITSD